MVTKKSKFSVLAAFFVFVSASLLQAVGTRDIDTVREKGVLGSEDFAVIDEFIAEAMAELVETTDFLSISRLRGVLITRCDSEIPGAQVQYHGAFSESCYKHLSSAMVTAEKLEPADLRFRMLLNLLIVIDRLSDPRLAELAITKLGDENAAIQYWAVHSLTNTNITEQLNFGNAQNLSILRDILDKLKPLATNASPETKALIAEFAGKVTTGGGEQLLLQIADERIANYGNWDVKYEPLDCTVFRALFDKLSSGQKENAEIGRRFAQLYSYAMQRYIKGRKVLTQQQKESLASVLVEAERSYISRLTELPQSVVKRAIEQGDILALIAENDRLFGGDGKAGQLPTLFKFDYGKDADGNKLTAPLELSDPKSE